MHAKEGRERELLRDAEQRLFATLGVEHESRTLSLREAPVARARVIEVGTGPPVLLMHGAGMMASIWAPLLAALPGRRLLAVDLPGCGLTDPFDHTNVELRAHAAAFVVAVLDALDTDRAPVVGNSLGGLYGLHAASAVPDRVPELVVMGAPGVALPGARGSALMALYSRPTLGRLIATLSPPLTPSMVRRLLVRLCGPGAVRAVPDELFEATAAAMRISDRAVRTLTPEILDWRTPRAGTALTDDELAALGQPTLFVWGAEDAFQGPEAAERAATVIPNAQVRVVAGGHHPWWDDAHGCAELVTRHLTSARSSDG